MIHDPVVAGKQSPEFVAAIPGHLQDLNEGLTPVDLEEHFVAGVSARTHGTHSRRRHFQSTKAGALLRSVCPV